MKIVARPIEMIAWFTDDGRPNPVKFRYQEQGKERTVIKVDRVIQTEETKIAGIRALVYRCQSRFGVTVKTYELK